MIDASFTNVSTATKCFVVKNDAAVFVHVDDEHNKSIGTSGYKAAFAVFGGYVVSHDEFRYVQRFSTRNCTCAGGADDSEPPIFVYAIAVG